MKCVDNSIAFLFSFCRQRRKYKILFSLWRFQRADFFSTFAPKMHFSLSFPPICPEIIFEFSTTAPKIIKEGCKKTEKLHFPVSATQINLWTKKVGALSANSTVETDNAVWRYCGGKNRCEWETQICLFCGQPLSKIERRRKQASFTLAVLSEILGQAAAAAATDSKADSVKEIGKKKNPSWNQNLKGGKKKRGKQREKKGEWSASLQSRLFPSF